MSDKPFDTLGPFQRGSIISLSLTREQILDSTLQHAFNQGFHRCKIGVMEKLKSLPPDEQSAMLALIRDVLPGRHDAPLDAEKRSATGGEEYADGRDFTGTYEP